MGVIVGSSEHQRFIFFKPGDTRSYRLQKNDVMADFSEYTGPSADWIALEPTLPKIPEVGVEELKQMLNKNREELAAQGMASGP